MSLYRKYFVSTEKVNTSMPQCVARGEQIKTSKTIDLTTRYTHTHIPNPVVTDIYIYFLYSYYVISLVHKPVTVYSCYNKVVEINKITRAEDAI